ncbi:tetratricopeptide repeat protein [Candidatus Woesearchaeota archaeon]|nr:tetratricopeptide repeat protein [Candidatus Woesearchaeota archaeon]
MRKTAPTIEEVIIQQGGFHRNKDTSGFPKGIRPSAISGAKSYLYHFKNEGETCEVIVLDNPSAPWRGAHNHAEAGRGYKIDKEKLQTWGWGYFGGVNLRKIEPLPSKNFADFLGKLEAVEKLADDRPYALHILRNIDFLNEFPKLGDVVMKQYIPIGDESRLVEGNSIPSFKARLERLLRQSVGTGLEAAVEPKMRLAFVAGSAGNNNELKQDLNAAITMLEDYASIDEVWLDEILQLTKKPEVGEQLRWRLDPAIQARQGTTDFQDYGYLRDTSVACYINRPDVIKVAQIYSTNEEPIRRAVARAFLDLVAEGNRNISLQFFENLASTYWSLCLEDVKAEALGEIGSLTLQTFRKVLNTHNFKEGDRFTKAYSSAFAEHLGALREHRPIYWSSIAAMVADNELKPEDIASVSLEDVFAYRKKRLTDTWEQAKSKQQSYIENTIERHAKPPLTEDELRSAVDSRVDDYMKKLLRDVDGADDTVKAQMYTAAEEKAFKFWNAIQIFYVPDRLRIDYGVIAAEMVAEGAIQPREMGITSRKDVEEYLASHPSAVQGDDETPQEPGPQGDFDTHYEQAYSLFKGGDFTRAAEHFKALVGLKPDDTWLHSDYAAALVKTGQPDAAKVEAQAAYDLDNANSDAKELLGL